MFLFVSFRIFFTRWQHISQIRYDLSTRLSNNILSTLLPNDILSGVSFTTFCCKIIIKILNFQVNFWNDEKILIFCLDPQCNEGVKTLIADNHVPRDSFSPDYRNV